MYATTDGRSSSRWPSIEKLNYAKTLLELALLLIALPWIIKALLRNPEQAVHDPGLSSLG